MKARMIRGVPVFLGTEDRNSFQMKKIGLFINTLFIIAVTSAFLSCGSESGSDENSKKVIQSTFINDNGYENLYRSITKDGKTPFKYIDCLYVAFADIDTADPDNSYLYYKYPDRAKWVIFEARKENPGIIIIAQANWISYFAPLVADAALARQRLDAFARSLPSFLKEYGFQGIDLDWESVPKGFKDDSSLATYLLQQINKYAPGALLSITPDDLPGLDVAAVDSIIDMVPIQSYERVDYIEKFHNAGFSYSHMYCGINSEFVDPRSGKTNDFFPYDRKIDKYTRKVEEHGLAGLYAWRIDNDDVDYWDVPTDVQVPRYTFTKLMWQYCRGETPSL